MGLMKLVILMVKKVTFFKYGAKNNWKKLLTLENIKKIEDIFREEMKELGYL